MAARERRAVFMGLNTLSSHAAKVLILWALFLVRGSFYCAVMPLWEGWDEYAHFAWLQHWVDKGTLPDFRDPVSREIDESMRLAPLAQELAWIGPPYLTHPQWWALGEAERSERVRKLAALPPGWAHQVAAHRFDFYEAQQPPLYYWIASASLRLAGSWPLWWRVLLIRLLSMGIASVAVPLVFLAARSILGDRLAVLCAALLAIAPGFAIDVSRVANDCLAIALVAVLFWLLPRRGWWWVGVTLGAALLSKAYMLGLVPGLVIVWWKRKRDLVFALAIAFALAGWWYARNVMLGRSLSGWLLHPNTGQVLRAVFQINWIGAAHVIAKSFIWFGGWSFLVMKSWIYAVVELTGVFALILALRSRRSGLGAPLVITGVYLAAMGWGVAVYFVAQNVPNLPGWYLWPMGSMIAVILVAGLGRYSMVLIAALGALDLYGVAALQVPYYAGLVERSHAAGGQFFAGLARRGVPVWWAVLWCLATFAIVVVAGMADYGVEKPSGHQR
jgi:4-amino-4-deoxy-L-arabinose transferase-like glycosyltransferase